ncbi:hypothetical protein [Streptomyces sp. NPDC050485]|uniref:hypothetical protein n=1 Tax=Streptomyces sp. NPDC050485 TaxID=3365617 RepID=UPI00379AE5B7
MAPWPPSRKRRARHVPSRTRSCPPARPGTAASRTIGRSRYDLALVSTDLQGSPTALIIRYAWRWSIEVTFAEARDLLGVGQARNRTENAVRRTVPFGLYCYSITVIWYTLHGHHPSDAADRRQNAPWYATKTEPSFSDMAAKLRRVIIAARFLPTSPGQPTDAEIRAVQQAWASVSDGLATWPCQNVKSREVQRSLSLRPW